jgi:glycosidase
MASFRTLDDVDWAALANRPHHPSPAAWEDQVFYFLLVDRFSDGREDGYRDVDGQLVAGTTPRLTAADRGNAVTTPADAAHWRAAGARWAGGTLAGLTSKIGYLERLGITALWVSPLLRQLAGDEWYHGYGIQNFLEVDPHFGTTEDLRTLVATAHEHGIYVVLDVIFNHTGDVFAYQPDRYWTPDGQGGVFLDPRWDGRPYDVAGFRDQHGAPTLPFAPVDLTAPPPRTAGVWPAELFDPATFTAKGRIVGWDNDPEYLEGDFFTLKDVHLGSGGPDDYRPSPALVALSRAYQYWIGEADVDGFRIDTVKHTDLGAARYFAAVTHEYAMSLGKENFYLLGEITGGRRRAYETLEITGIDAALGIDEIPEKLESTVKGTCEPKEYFDLFRNSLLVQKESHVWFRNKVVTVYDDHDQVRKGEHKARFCADGDGPALALAVLALTVTTLGIPCVYYGSEQALDGEGGNDRYLREAMFGGDFGAFRSRCRHVFDEDHPVYRELATILALRRSREHIGLRRGRQYLRPISGDGEHFGLPRPLGGRMLSVVPWSRVFLGTETVCAVNTDPHEARSAWVTVDAGLHAPGATLTCRYSSDHGQVGTAAVAEARNGRAVRLTVPPGGFVLYQ